MHRMPCFSRVRPISKILPEIHTMEKFEFSQMYSFSNNVILFSYILRTPNAIVKLRYSTLRTLTIGVPVYSYFAVIKIISIVIFETFLY